MSNWDCLMQRIKNVLRWIPVLWQDRDWDWIYLLILIEKKIAFMREANKDSRFVGMNKSMRRMRVCELLIQRLVNDSYWDNNRILKFYDNGNYKRFFRHIDYMINQDMDLLFKLLRKHIMAWWF